jgi:hypothetical protein
MGGIDAKRWLLGGLAAGVLMWLVEGLSSLLYMDKTKAALESHGLAMEMGAGAMATGLLVSLISGLTIVFIYAMARARLGPGPRTAVTVAVMLFVGGYMLWLLGYRMMGLFSDGLLLAWGAIGLVEMVLAALLGGYIYRE